MFEEDARNALIQYLGYTQAPLTPPAEQEPELAESVEQPVEQPVVAPTITAEDLFASASPKNATSPAEVLEPVAPAQCEEQAGEPVSAEEKAWEQALKERIIVGDFASAVEVCFQYQRYADALVLSAWGGAELMELTTVCA